MTKKDEQQGTGRPEPESERPIAEHRKQNADAWKANAK